MIVWLKSMFHAYDSNERVVFEFDFDLDSLKSESTRIYFENNSEYLRLKAWIRFRFRFSSKWIHFEENPEFMDSIFWSFVISSDTRISEFGFELDSLKSESTLKRIPKSEFRFSYPTTRESLIRLSLNYRFTLTWIQWNLIRSSRFRRYTNERCTKKFEDTQLGYSMLNCNS